MATTATTLRERSILMGLLDKILGVPTRASKAKPKVNTDPVALARIERTQQELAARLDKLDVRVKRVEDTIQPPTEEGGQ